MTDYYLPVSHFQQSADGYCLPVCVRMVLAYLGINRSESEISYILGTKSWGTPSFAIERLTSLKIKVIYQEWSTAELVATLEIGRPVIAFIRTGFLDHYEEDFAHAIVIIGGQDQQVWIHDPAKSKGPVAVSWNGLLAAWSEFDYRGAVLLAK
jgi:ABC-type bacteriocin/lantibiotic exporter with double-glycine peptidase domain